MATIDFASDGFPDKVVTQEHYNRLVKLLNNALMSYADMNFVVGTYRDKAMKNIQYLIDHLTVEEKFCLLDLIEDCAI